MTQITPTGLITCRKPRKTEVLGIRRRTVQFKTRKMVNNSWIRTSNPNLRRTTKVYVLPNNHRRLLTSQARISHTLANLNLLQNLKRTKKCYNKPCKLAAMCSTLCRFKTFHPLFNSLKNRKLLRKKVFYNVRTASYQLPTRNYSFAVTVVEYNPTITTVLVLNTLFRTRT